MKIITPHQALAIQVLKGKPEAQQRIVAKEPFVFVYGDKKLTIRFIKDEGNECGLDGCNKKGVQWGKCWDHASC